MTQPEPRRSLGRVYIELFEGIPTRRTTMVLTPLIWLAGVVAAADWGSKYGVAVATAAAILAGIVWGGAILLVRIWERQTFRKLNEHIAGRSLVTLYQQATPARRWVMVLTFLVLVVLSIFAAWFGYSDGVTPQAGLVSG